MFKRILVAIDHSAPAARALRVAGELGEELAARIGVLYVIDTTPAFATDVECLTQQYLESQRTEADTFLQQALSTVPKACQPERFVAEGDPAEMILKTAKDWHAGVIFIGNNSRGRLAHFLLGSTADAVIRKSACPVMSVRATVSSSAEAKPLFAL